MNKKIGVLILILIFIIGLVIGINIFCKKDDSNWITDNNFLYA